MARNAPIYRDNLLPPIGGQSNLRDWGAITPMRGTVIPRNVPNPVLPPQMVSNAPVLPKIPKINAIAPQVKPEGLINDKAVGAGLLGAAQQIGAAGGPSEMPISTGSVIGPALASFASEYDKARKEKMITDAQRAAVEKYGPTALLKGALGPLIKQEGETKARNQLLQSVSKIFSPDSSEARSAANMTWTPQRQVTLEAAALKGPEAVSTALRDFEKTDNAKVKDARDRLKPSIELFRQTQVKVDKVNRSVVMKNGTADLAAINSFQRLIDDGVVRGEDVALQKRTQSLYEYLEMQKATIAKGHLLSDGVRQRMAAVANQLGQSVYVNFAEIVKGQKELAEQNRVPWNRVWASSMDKYLEPKEPQLGDQGGVEPGAFKYPGKK